jgi:hypothetical protein
MPPYMASDIAHNFCCGATPVVRWDLHAAGKI